VPVDAQVLMTLAPLGALVSAPPVSSQQRAAPPEPPCAHRTPVRYEMQDVEVSPYGDTEAQLVAVGGESTMLDLDIGRFRCSLCGDIGYYTGLWRNFYEKGIPCPGSELVRRYRSTADRA
jgi:hypothetical protein